MCSKHTSKMYYLQPTYNYFLVFLNSTEAIHEHNWSKHCQKRILWSLAHKNVPSEQKQRSSNSLDNAARSVNRF